MQQNVTGYPRRFRFCLESPKFRHTIPGFATILAGSANLFSFKAEKACCAKKPAIQAVVHFETKGGDTHRKHHAFSQVLQRPNPL
jgi:hypothetical protein